MIVAKQAERDQSWSALAEGEPVRLTWEIEDVQLLLG
jgi:hypothetical protein